MNTKSDLVGRPKRSLLYPRSSRHWFPAVKFAISAPRPRPIFELEVLAKGDFLFNAPRHAEKAAALLTVLMLVASVVIAPTQASPSEPKAGELKTWRRLVPPRVQRFLEEMPVKFPVLLDVSGSMAKAWKISALTSTVIQIRIFAAALAL